MLGANNFHHRGLGTEYQRHQFNMEHTRCDICPTLLHSFVEKSIIHS